jgi:hypothetical protein
LSRGGRLASNDSRAGSASATISREADAC